MDIRGKTAIVTGGGSGIGRATSLALAAEGANVVVVDLDEAGGRETTAKIQMAGGKSAGIRADVRSRRQIEEMVSYADETFGGVDILHANAGVGTPRPRFPDADPDGWERTLAIDLWAVIACSQAVVPAMKRSGGGVIVNTASIAGLMAYAPDPIYAAAKHGVVGFTRSMEHLKAEANIRVNCVCPGVVDTPMVRYADRGMTPDELSQRDAFLKSIPLISPETIAEAVMTLIKDDSLNGVAMAVTFGRPPRVVEAPMRFNRTDPAQQQQQQ